MQQNNWYVLTGGPSTGKTTLIEALERRGYVTVPEAARTFIEQELARGRSIEEIRRDGVAFQHALIPMKMTAHIGLPRNQIAFFDRGMHDSEAYLRLQGVCNHPDLAQAFKKISYKKVFLLDPIAYAPDAVRTETLEEAMEIQKLLREVYEEARIPITPVPVLPIEERLAYILERL